MTLFILLFLGFALVLVPLFRSFGLGSVLGFLTAGLLLGPNGLKLVFDTQEIFHISELGVTILLFVIGLELQPKRLWTLRAQVFGLGSLQMLVTGGLIAVLLNSLNMNWTVSILMGLGLAMSSTAFVLQTLAERNELSSLQGQQSFSVLLFQDLSVAPLLAAAGVLAIKENSTATAEPFLIFKKIAWVLLAIFFLVVASRYLLRPIFRWLITRGGPEIFTAAALFIVIGTSSLMAHLGLSAALGAFLAGVLLADSEYRHELEANLDPFKGLLMGLFFMAVGMSVELNILFERPLYILLLTCGIMLLKAAVLFVVSRLFKDSWSQSRKLSLYLCQGGEFAFVLFAQSKISGLGAVDDISMLSVVVTLSMFLSPFLILFESKVLSPFFDRKKNEDVHYDSIDESNPIVIAGFGRFGQIIGRVLNMHKIPFTAIESSANHVEFLRRFGNKVYFGDASRLEIMRSARLDHAQMIVVCIDNVDASLKIISMVKKHFPHLKVMARARNRFHCYKLMDLKVDYLIRDTLLSSIEMTKHVLFELGIKPAQIEKTISTFIHYDEELLTKQHAIYSDEAQLLETTQQALTELENLFMKDTQTPGAENLEIQERMTKL